MTEQQVRKIVREEIGLALGRLYGRAAQVAFDLHCDFRNARRPVQELMEMRRQAAQLLKDILDEPEES